MIAADGILNIANLSIRAQDILVDSKVDSNDQSFKQTLDKSIKKSKLQEKDPLQIRRTQKEPQIEQVSTSQLKHTQNEPQIEQVSTLQLKHAQNEPQIEQVGTSQIDEQITESSKKATKLEQLNEENKKLVEILAGKLEVTPEELINLLNILKVDLNDLKELGNVDTILSKINDIVTDFSSKTQADKNTLLKAKIQLILDNNGHGIDKVHYKLKISQKNVPENNITAQPAQDIQQINTKINTTGQEQLHVEDRTLQNQAEFTTQVEAEIKNDINKQDFQLTKPQLLMAKEADSTNEVGEVLDEANVKTDISNSNKQQQAVNTPNAPKLPDKIEVINYKTSREMPNVNEQQNLFNTDLIKHTFDRFVPFKNITQTVITKQDVFNQIVEHAKLILREKQTEMELSLKPENLGKLSLKISTENGVVAAKITTHTYQVKEIIESNLIQLKEALKEQGLNIQDLNVSVEQDPRQQLYGKNLGNSKIRLKVSLDDDMIKISKNYANAQTQNPYLISDSKINYIA